MGLYGQRGTVGRINVTRNLLEYAFLKHTVCSQLLQPIVGQVGCQNHASTSDILKVESCNVYAVRQEQLLAEVLSKVGDVFVFFLGWLLDT